MGQMLEGYLAFARGDTGESTTRTDVGSMLEDLRADAERHGVPLSVETRGDLNIRVRPMAMKRCVGNLVANAQRHADTSRLGHPRAARSCRSSSTTTAPASPPTIARTSSGRSTGWTRRATRTRAAPGFGLAIARDIARSHGGDITLSESPMGGLRAAVRIPV